MGDVPSQQRALLVGLLTVVTAVAFEGQAVTTAMPAAARDLGQVELYAWAFTAQVMAMIVAIVLAGRLVDRLGPVRPFLVGLGLLATGTVLAASAPTMAVLLAGRFVQGLGGGAVNLALMVVTGIAFPAAARARVMTWYSAAWMLPSLVGPGVAAWVSETWSWHWVFWGVLPLMLLGGGVVLPGLRRLPPARPREDAPAPVWAALAVAGATALLQGAGQAREWWSVPLVVAGLGLLWLGAPRLMPAGEGVALRGLRAVVGVRALAAGSFFGATAFLPLALIEQHRVSLLLAGLAVTLSSTGWMVGSWVQSRPWLRWRRDQIVVVGSLLIAGGLAVTGAALATGLGWIVVPVVGIALAGVGMGLQSASTALVVMQTSGQRELGHNTSALQVGEMIGNALLTGFAGTLFAWLGGAGSVSPFGVIVAVLAVAATASVAVASRIGPVENQAVTVPKP